jgi:hypothetical protein
LEQCSFFLIWLAYLFSNGAVLAFFQNLYFHTFQKILVEGTISTPFITPSGTIINTVGKALFYLLPVLASFWALFIVIQKKGGRACERLAPQGWTLLFLDLAR